LVGWLCCRTSGSHYKKQTRETAHEVSHAAH
jgi:hypothetical protein